MSGRDARASVFLLAFVYRRSVQALYACYSSARLDLNVRVNFVSEFQRDFERSYFVTDPLPTNPCRPSPCGPNSQCREVNGQAVCSCLASYMGQPPNCRPECVSNAECASHLACNNYKCVDPCPGTCGQNAECRVIQHNPICSCRSGFTGDPFVRCSHIPRK